MILPSGRLSQLATNWVTPGAIASLRSLIEALVGTEDEYDGWDLLRPE